MPPEGTGQLVPYRTEDGRTRISCLVGDDSVRLTQAAIADPFKRRRRTSLYISEQSTRRGNPAQTQPVRNTYKFARKAPGR
jgi:hypothetical protein